MQTSLLATKNSSNKKKGRNNQLTSLKTSTDLTSTSPLAAKALSCLTSSLESCGELMATELHRKVTAPLLCLAMRADARPNNRPMDQPKAR